METLSESKEKRERERERRRRRRRKERRIENKHDGLAKGRRENGL